MAIRTLCIIEDADRPTIATFIGMHTAGIELKVFCPADQANFKLLDDAGVAVVDKRFSKNIDRAGIKALREELVLGRWRLEKQRQTEKPTTGGRGYCRRYREGEDHDRSSCAGEPATSLEGLCCNGCYKSWD